MKVVLDTNIFVSALKSNMGASYAIISQLPSEKFRIVLFLYMWNSRMFSQDRNIRAEQAQQKKSLLFCVTFAVLPTDSRFFFCGVRGLRI